MSKDQLPPTPPKLPDLPPKISDFDLDDMLHRRPEKPVPTTTPAPTAVQQPVIPVDLTLAERELEHLDILTKIQSRLTTQGYIGELSNKVKVYLIGLSKDGPRDARIHLLLIGPPGVGKSALLGILRRYFEPNIKLPLSERTVLDWHRMTAASPDHLGEVINNLDGKILIISQLEGMADSQYSLMVVMDPEETGLNLLTVKGTSEENTLEEISLNGIPTLVSTTTWVKLDPQITRRADGINPDESPEQTAQIKLHKAQRWGSKEYKKQIKTADMVLKTIPLYLKQYSEYEILIPFATAVIEYIPNVLLARSDVDKIFSYTSQITKLHIKKRLILHDENENTIISSPADNYYTWFLCKDSFERRLADLRDTRAFKVLKCLRESITPDVRSVSLAGTSDNPGFMHTLRQKGILYALNTVHQALEELEDKGYVVSERDSRDKRHNLYTLTDRAMIPLNIRFPMPEVESAYINYVTNHFCEQTEAGNTKFRDARDYQIFKNSFRVFEVSTGVEITQQVISQQTLRMWLQ